MKGTGIARKIDDLGRIVIPIEIRDVLGIQKQDLLDISIEENKIVLTKKMDVCIICGQDSGLQPIKTKHICTTCVTEMNSIE